MPLYFLLEFELIRPRWYWFNERVVYLQQQYRLSYNALTRQYRARRRQRCYQNFATLAEALEVHEPRAAARRTSSRARCSAATPIPRRCACGSTPRSCRKPFQLNALGSRDWNIGSDWYRWTVTP